MSLTHFLPSMLDISKKIKPNRSLTDILNSVELKRWICQIC